MSDSEQDLEALWADDANWTASSIYSCPADPRVMVPKRPRWAGWTMNFSHRLAWPGLLGILVLGPGPAGLAALLFPEQLPIAISAGVGVGIVLVTLLVWRLTKPWP